MGRTITPPLLNTDRKPTFKQKVRGKVVKSEKDNFERKGSGVKDIAPKKGLIRRIIDFLF